MRSSPFKLRRQSGRRMATRAAAHSGTTDASAIASAAMATMHADRGNDDLSTSVDSNAQNAPQAVLDHSAYDPSTAESASAASVVTSAGDATLRASPLSSIRRVALPVMSRSRIGRHSSKFGTVNYSIDEMRRLIEKVRAVMPIASEDWLHVAYQFNYMRPESIPYREVESLKRKFKKMYCSRSTVGGKLPEYVQEAKELRKQINQRSERAQIQLEQANSDSQSEADLQDGGSEDSTKEAAESSADRGNSGEQTTETVTEHRGVAVEGSAVAMHAASGGEDASEATREVAARLKVMEEEYHRSMASKRSSAPPAEGGASSVSGASAGYPPEAAFLPHLATPLSSASVYTAGAMGSDSTAGIINLLKHSIERKRRTIEEQMLSESERVRKERKKRKMEQVLYNIHREHEITTSGGGASDALPSESVAFPPHHPLLHASSSSQILDGASSSPSSSLGVMEIVLSYMVTQQQEATRRAQAEDEQRRLELAQREQRRRAKELQRRKDKHEMMLVMAALLQDGFPEELRHYLDPASVNVDMDEEEEGRPTDDSTIRGPAQLLSQSKPVASSSSVEAAATAAAIASSLAPVSETLL